MFCKDVTLKHVVCVVCITFHLVSVVKSVVEDLILPVCGGCAVVGFAPVSVNWSNGELLLGNLNVSVM